MFWMGKELSPIEIASVLSVQRVGHSIDLFSYERPHQLPIGVNWVNASEILQREKFVLYKGVNPALGANLFRYKLMSAEKWIWLDTDILLLKPIHHTKDDVYGWQDGTRINNAVLYLPSSSPVLFDLIEYTKNEYPVPPFFEQRIRNELVVARMAGKPVHVSRMPWGVWGPNALTYFVKKNGHENKARPVEVFYPVHYSEAHMLITAGYDVEARLSESTISIHLWNSSLQNPSNIRPYASAGNVSVDKGSYLEKFCRRELALSI